MFSPEPLRDFARGFGPPNFSFVGAGRQAPMLLRLSFTEHEALADCFTIPLSQS